MKETAMAKTRGTGLLMVWTDIDAEFEPEFNRWYDEEHLSRLMHPRFSERWALFCVEGRPEISGNLRAGGPQRIAQFGLS
jgi:hypothetical protein